jgi:hypothetical protein
LIVSHTAYDPEDVGTVFCKDDVSLKTAMKEFNSSASSTILKIINLEKYNLCSKCEDCRKFTEDEKCESEFHDSDIKMTPDSNCDCFDFQSIKTLYGWNKLWQTYIGLTSDISELEGIASRIMTISEEITKFHDKIVN